MIDEKLLNSFLKHKTETDCFDFKQKLKLFDATGKLNPTERDELIKDVLGLANGNVTIVRKTKYLIIGAHDKSFDNDGMRLLYDVDYQVPTRGEITKWVNDACAPSIVGIECEYATIRGRKLYIVTIPPTFDLHETIRELNAKGHHSKYTVFMRRDEHTVPASVRDGVTLQQRKFLYRHETSNPSSVISGAIIGAIVALVFWNSGYSTNQPDNDIVVSTIRILVTIFGVLFGASMGWGYQNWHSLRYDWRYYSRAYKVVLVTTLVVITLGLGLLFWRLL